MVFFKGKLKLYVLSKGNNSVGLDDSFARHFIDLLNEKVENQSNAIQIFFKEQCLNYERNTEYGEQSFDEIMEEVLGETGNVGGSKENNKYKNQIKKSQYLSNFEIEYYVRSIGKNVDSKNIIINIENLIKNTSVYGLEGDKTLISKHKLTKKSKIEIFDDLVHVNKEILKRFCGGIVDDRDINVLSRTFFTCDVQKLDVSKQKMSIKEIREKNKELYKYNALRDEIDRAFKVGENKSIQGVNYLFNETNTNQRRGIYKVLAETLYSVGRIEKPWYYIVEIDVNDNNFETVSLYLKNRIKMSQDCLYFFEFYRKEQCNNPFDNCCSNDKGINGFLKNLINNQYTLSFGIYADEEAKDLCDYLLDKSLNEKYSLVVFDGKLNKEAQIEYAKNRLERINQLDLFSQMVEIIEYQSNQVDGLTTLEVDDLILRVLKGKYEKIYKPIYKKATSDLLNGNITEKLMKMIGLKNLKQAVQELKNKIDFSNFNEELLPVTRALNRASCIERNNWILTGEPGTGKSTAAEILEKVMYQEKIIKKDLLVKYTPSNNEEDNLISFADLFSPKYVSTIKESFTQAVGGVLVVDEIGHLSKNDKSLLLQLMEENKKDVAVILCGYEHEAKELLEYNPGFRSRFTHIIKMENYTVNELFEIFVNKLNEKHFHINNSLVETAKEIINKAKQVPNFGQARFIESLADKLISIHSSAKLSMLEEIAKNNVNIKITENDVFEIEKSDFDKLALEDMLGEEYLYIMKHGNPYVELNNLIGCQSVKSAVDEFLAKTEIDKLKIKRKKLSKSDFNLNMVFYGSPGTAKTTVARLVARILYDKGIINVPKVMEVGASDLIADYVGQTSHKVVDVFNKAKGGVLFIDEAYSLANKSAGGYNQEAIDTIIKEMENCRSNTMVIFAGYKKPMEEFIQCNPGFKSRISKFVDFKNYTLDELVQIFEKLVKDMGYTLDVKEKEKIIEKVSVYISEKMTEEDFGNGRVCRTMIEDAINRQSKRLSSKKDDDITDEELMTLKISDFNTKIDDFYETKIIGFAA